MFELNEHSDIKFLEINSICDFLNENFCKQITNQMLAEKFHYHPYYLNRIFKEKIGVTIHRYIIECRITEAKMIVMTTLSLSMDTTLDTFPICRAL